MLDARSGSAVRPSTSMRTGTSSVATVGLSGSVSQLNSKINPTTRSGGQETTATRCAGSVLTPDGTSSRWIWASSSETPWSCSSVVVESRPECQRPICPDIATPEVEPASIVFVRYARPRHPSSLGRCCPPHQTARADRQSQRMLARKQITQRCPSLQPRHPSGPACPQLRGRGHAGSGAQRPEPVLSPHVFCSPEGKFLHNFERD